MLAARKLEDEAWKGKDAMEEAKAGKSKKRSSPEKVECRLCGLRVTRSATMVRRSDTIRY